MKDYITHNGKRYKRVDENYDRRVSIKEVHKWLKGLEEYRYRKIPNVDVRRVTSFINNGLSETDLPQSLQKKWEHAKYGKEKHLADRYIKQKISQKNPDKIDQTTKRVPKSKNTIHKSSGFSNKRFPIETIAKIVKDIRINKPNQTAALTLR